MILDIDIGNTRLKWVLRDAQGAGVARGAMAHNQHLGGDWAFPFSGKVTRVRMASVMGKVEADVKAISRKKWQIEPEMAKVVDGCAGVTCGYQDSARLGVDRWLAVLAARALCRRDFMVVSAGSALTIDLVTRDGIHQGGYILPGLSMMVNALDTKTWGIKVENQVAHEVLPGRTTSAAVRNGGLVALLGAVERTARDSVVKKIFITGGNGEALAEHIQVQAEIEVIPELVLDGLMVALP